VIIYEIIIFFAVARYKKYVKKMLFAISLFLRLLEILVKKIKEQTLPWPRKK